MARPPPASPLFPYTTLFRSTEPIGPGSSVLKIKDGGGAPGEAPVALAIAFRTRALLQHEDRKSTRLNSSHVSISYAVFCLKKKIKRRGLTPAPKTAGGPHTS